MWKVIIVDDEVLVRRGLASTIPWSKYNMQVIGDFSNGAKALEAMTTLKPDVVITDIRMPHMDGLTFLKAIRESYPETICVILSCHDDFNYAKEAIHLGAVNYLVKTAMDETEVDLALGKIQQSLEKRKNMNALLRQVEQVRWLERQAELREALNGDIVPETTGGIGNQRKDNGCFLLLVAKPVNPAGSSIFFSACRQLESLYGQESDWFCALDVESYLIVVLRNPATLSSLQVQQMCQTWSGRLLQLFDSKREDLYIGASAPFPVLAVVKQAVEEANQGMEAFFYDEGEQSFYTPEFAKPDQVEIDSLFAIEDRQQCLEAIRMQSPQQFRMIFKRLSNLWNPGVPSAVVKEMAAMMVEMIRIEKNRKQSLLQASASSEFHAMSKLSQLISRVEYEIDLWEREIENPQSSFPLRPEIQKSISYIQRHLQEEIKMHDVAEHVQLSRSHFSALFKQAMGKTFLEYVIEKRMERATEIIRETNKKLYEVANEVGFSDYKYFTRCFKEYVGTTPKEWREQLYLQT